MLRFHKARIILCSWWATSKHDKELDWYLSQMSELYDDDGVKKKGSYVVLDESIFDKFVSHFSYPTSKLLIPQAGRKFSSTVLMVPCAHPSGVICLMTCVLQWNATFATLSALMVGHHLWRLTAPQHQVATSFLPSILHTTRGMAQGYVGSCHLLCWFK